MTEAQDAEWVVPKPLVYILCYQDHDADHILMVCDSNFKAQHVMNQLTEHGLSPIPDWNEWHGHQRKSWFINSLIIREERLE